MTNEDISHPLTEALVARLRAETQTLAEGRPLSYAPNARLSSLADQLAQAQQDLMRLVAANTPNDTKTSVTAETASTAVDAANEDWFDCPVYLAAAATAAPTGGLIRKLPAPDSPRRFTLTQAPMLGGGATSLIFKADKDSVSQYLGAHVTVTIGDRAFDLGRVNANGVARQRVDGAIEDATPSIVRIRKALQPRA